MAQAYKCDLCGKFYTGKGGRTRTIVLGFTPSSLNDRVSKYDICPDCESSFILWLDSRNPNHKSAFEDKEDVNLFDGDVK